MSCPFCGSYGWTMGHDGDIPTQDICTICNGSGNASWLIVARDYIANLIYSLGYWIEPKRPGVTTVEPDDFSIEEATDENA